MPEWMSFNWFFPNTLRGFYWDNPFYFYFILAIPFIYFLRWLLKRSKGRRLSLSVILSEKLNPNWSSIRLIIPFFFTLGLINLIFAIARPQRSLQDDLAITEGINMVLAIDISESMKAEDLKPNRLTAAKNVARQFLQNRKNDKIGIVVFAGEAMTVCPITNDYGLVANYLDHISWGLLDASGTAIGSAIAVSINRLRDTPGKNKAIILISDGDNTAGNLSPMSASELAKSFGIRIYTIAIGKDEMGSRKVLSQVADNSQGEFFEALSNSSLMKVFESIDNLEKTRFSETIIKEVRDYYYVYLNWAMLFFLIAFLLKNTFLGNALED
jgi:Ca-activated chloride channel homolog